LNATPESDAVQIMLAGDWRDSRALSETPPAGPVGTSNGFEVDAHLRDRIDYIFVSPHWRVRRYAALADTVHGRYP
jgi:endonuclease/exonuclease/phosphatase family metal-dependent hydrolase